MSEQREPDRVTEDHTYDRPPPPPRADPMAGVQRADPLVYPYVGETLGAFFTRIACGETAYKFTPADLVSAVETYTEVNDPSQYDEPGEMS